MADHVQDFSVHPLDPGFVIAKPIQSASEDMILDLESRGLLRIQRKHNGHGLFASSAGRLYSRTVNDLTENFPAIAEELREADLPHGTLLVCEGCVEEDGVESLGTFGGLVKSLPARAVREQREKRIAVQLRIFNIAAYKSKPVLHLPYDDRKDLLAEIFHRHRSRNIHVVDNLPLSFEEAKQQSLANNWEGLVLYDGSAASAFRLDGKHDRVPRPEGCWKWKNYKEEDFVVTGWVPSDAKTRGGMVRDINIAQYHPVTEELVGCGRTSSGLSLRQRQELADDSRYPRVAEIRYECRTKTGKLVGAEILRFRDDKSPRECLFPLL